MDGKEEINTTSNSPNLNSNHQEKLAKLYQEVQALKMAALSAFFKISKNSDLAQDAHSAKLSQLILKAIEIQLRLLAELEKKEKVNPAPPPVEIIWEIMFNLPELKPILSREEIRQRILDALRARQASLLEPNPAAKEENRNEN